MGESLKDMMYFFVIFGEVIILSHASNDKNVLFLPNLPQHFFYPFLTLPIDFLIPSQLLHHHHDRMLPLHNKFLIALLSFPPLRLLTQHVLYLHLVNLLSESLLAFDELVDYELHCLIGLVVLVVDVIVEIAEHY
jgi:hypothetical protein